MIVAVLPWKASSRRDLEVVAQVGAALAPAAPPRPPRPPRSSPKKFSKMSDMKSEKSLPKPGPPAAAIGEGRMAEAVVGRALLAVREDLIGLVDFLELDLGFLVARIAVRVVLHRELAEGGFHLRLGRGLRDAEDLVIVALGHQRRPQVLLTIRCM